MCGAELRTLAPWSSFSFPAEFLWRRRPVKDRRHRCFAFTFKLATFSLTGRTDVGAQAVMHRHTERQSGNVFLKVCQHCTTRTSFTLAFYCSAAILHIGGPTDSVDATAPQSATAAASLSNSRDCVAVVQQQQPVPAILKFSGQPELKRKGRFSF